MDGQRVALVTGAASGIGRAAARAFAHAGYETVIADINEPESPEANCRFIRCDVSDQTAVSALIAAVVAEHGRLDAAFNNAGVLGELAATGDSDPEAFDRVIAVNLRGTYLCLREELKQMAKQEGGGAIVNCSSVAGLVGLAGAPAYVASKHGIVGLTRTAALEYAKANIRVNAICPGPIETKMLEDLMVGMPREAIVAAEPVGRIGRPEEIAEAVLWLCSPAASFVTGQAIAADGGWTVQ
jgi:Dehydrogenases with different specificities (related to short-chain alcohol dehydrogenases)